MALPIFIWDKVGLLLVLADMKQGSEMLSRGTIIDWKNLRVTSKARTIKRIKNFLKATGLSFRVRKKIVPVHRWRKTDGKMKRINLKEEVYYFYFSKRIEIVDKLVDGYKGRRFTRDEEMHNALGHIYGFPNEAVEVYAKAMSNKSINKWPEDLESLDEFNKKYGTEEWAAYAAYVGRKNHVEDYETAKNWWKYIKKVCPELDKKVQELSRNI